MGRWTHLGSRFGRRKRRTGTSFVPNWSWRPVPAKCEGRTLAEAVFWCSQQPLVTNSDDPDYLYNSRLIKQRKFGQVDFKSLHPLSAQLRSPILRPAILIGEVSSESEREALVALVISQRAELIALKTSLDESRILRERKGRLLNYFPAENLADGAAEVASLGFFDVENAPPWDTWVEYSEGRLACWVPEPLIGLAEAGVDANPEGCIQWAD